MNVFTIGAPEGYEWVLPVHEEDFEILRFDGTPRRAGWEPVPMRRLRVDARGQCLQDSDFPTCSGSDMLMCRERAVTALRETLETCGELLPLACADGLPLWTLNVTQLLDALDEEESTLLRVPETGKILRVIAPRFRRQKLAGSRLFKLAQAPKGLIYASEEFVRSVQPLGLRGIEFKEV